jgi:hypothetical protein
VRRQNLVLEGVGYPTATKSNSEIRKNKNFAFFDDSALRNYSFGV